MPNCFQAALDYAGRGFSVIPVRGDKKPFIPWAEYQDRRATADEIRAWWVKWPDAMVGIVTGPISGLLIIDADNEEAYQRLQELLPDSFVTCIAKTPRGYHLYLVYPQDQTIGNAAGVMPGVDIRGNHGYGIAPPSVNAEGKAYRWLDGLSPNDVAPAHMPLNLYNSFSLYKDLTKPTLQPLTDLTKPYKMFEHGTRDNDLFHTANCLVKGGMPQSEIMQILERLIFSWGEKPDRKWIDTKIESALKRADRRERNLTEEFKEWATLQEGYWNLTEAKQTLQLLTKEEKAHLDVIVHRLKKEGFIEKYGNKAGVYRRVDKEFERVDFLSAAGQEFEINLPLELHELGKLYPGNIAVIAGSKEAGKTAFLLNVAKEMLSRTRIVYLNSEMGPDEIKNRLINFEDVSLAAWAEHMQVFNLKSTQTPADFIDGSETLWIIDYLEIAEDFSRIALPIAGIHERLGKGLAFIGIQKADGKEIGRGADFSREKARLYVSLDWDSEKRMNRIKIIDCKAWRNRNPRGLVRYYKLVKGARIVPQGYWTNE